MFGGLPHITDQSTQTATIVYTVLSLDSTLIYEVYAHGHGRLHPAHPPACVDYGCVYVMTHDVVAHGASTYMAPYCCTPWNAAVEAMPSVR